MSNEEKKPGVYLCGGCGIKEAISLDGLKNVATLEMGVKTCRQADAFCTGEGYEQIKSDLASGEVNQVIISGCSPRVMAQEFNALNTQVIRSNVREQVLWTQHDNEDEEDTQMFADDNLRMACAQAQTSERPEKHWGGVESVKLLVVGGGVSGLTAAKEAASFGVNVTLVEKSDTLGGWSGKWSKTIPYKTPYRGLQENMIPDLIKEVEDNDLISVHTNTIVNRTEGMPGKFSVNLKNGASDDWDVFGAIVVATGWREWDTSKLEYLGYGKKGVMTDIEFETKLAEGDLPETAAFIIPNNEEMMPFSSGVTTKVAIKQAVQVMDANPKAMCYVLYEDLRAHGMAEEFYREAQEKGVIFQRAEIKSVADDLTITYFDDMLEEDIPLGGLDNIVITTGMVPNTTNVDIEPVEEGASLLVDDINPTAPFDFIKADDAGEEDSDQPIDISGGPVLNLQYKQGPHLPVLANGFADSHYICFPYETRRTGIHTCGPVRRPMTIGEAIEDAQGATLKAIQAMRAANASEAVIPRAGDLSFPNFGFDICTKCKRCTIECPFSAIDEDPETGYPMLNPSRCRRCGTCMGACPVRTITFTNYNPQMVSEMISVVEMPDEFDEKPRILVLACENDAYPALDMTGINRQSLNPYMRFIPVRCLGSVTLLWVSTALEKGYDGVLLMGCKSGDDYQCHFVKGSGLAEERMSKVGETLQSLMLEPERVGMMEVSIADSANLSERLNKFSEEIVEMGLNPFK